MILSRQKIQASGSAKAMRMPVLLSKNEPGKVGIIVSSSARTVTCPYVVPTCGRGWGRRNRVRTPLIPRPEGEEPRSFPLGNMAVGVITEVGPEVTRFGVGDRVFGHLPIRETHTVDEGAVDPLPDGLEAEAVVYLDPAVMALAIRDASIRLGDQVAVFGLGAIGLMALQMARIAGADQVIGVDPIKARRGVAKALGADTALDPLADGGDAGMAIRRISGAARSEVEPPDGACPRRLSGGADAVRPARR
jgi:threonine dehydrogenase-like Zn-dependent dehydrogenase